MKGAEAAIAAARNAGIDICFANPGTTEMPLVLALDATGGVRGVLCLHENVATGAADGYARMAGKPAMCLLHLGPGLANGLTNLHNARRAYSPVLNIIGEHASWHTGADPLLNSDIASLAHWVGEHVVTVKDAASIAGQVAAAAAAAMANGSIASVIIPHDFQITHVDRHVPDAPLVPSKTFTPSRVGAAHKALKAGSSAILLGGEALSVAGLELAGRIAAATGADLLCDTFFARMERGFGLLKVTKLPYFPDMALHLTQRYQHVVIAGTRRPVSFFGYPNLPSYLTTDEQTVMLADAGEDVLGALKSLADDLKVPGTIAIEEGSPPPLAKGVLEAASVSAIIARLQPRDCIVMDEALTVGIPYYEASQFSPRFTHLMLTGGAIGQGPSAAAGAALGCPGRKVINFQSDGCGAYSVQALWTQARENLDVVTIIGANRSYNILRLELLRAGVVVPGTAARSMSTLDKPYLDWARIAEGFGVPAVTVDSGQALARELEKALAQKGPRLIEAIMA